MVPLRQLTADTILSDTVLTEVFEQEDEIEKARLILSLLDRAKELGVKAKLMELIKAYRQVERQVKKQQTRGFVASQENWTDFSGDYQPMFCGAWMATDRGIYSQTSDYREVLACYHPILPVERMKNLETGDEQLKLAFKRNDNWTEIIVPKGLIAKANSITTLADKGVSVNSENAKHLVRFLADVENFNEHSIPVKESTSKLGWIGSGFVPYFTDIIFDGDNRFKQVYESIGEHGNKEQWYRMVKDIRTKNRREIKFALATSFASVLVGLLKLLPFIVDMWGSTEGGKSVSMMLAASIWANPDENKYIGDFKTTDVQLEARNDLLNHLPLMLDDTSKVSSKLRDNFEGFVYDLCSGKGKSRSNRDLGIAKENRWRNAILTNGERPLTSYVFQGGAINRVLEIEFGENVYDDPVYVADMLKKHYGFAGKDFVEVVRKLGTARIEEMQKTILEEIYSDEKMQKQSISLSAILTADKIATDYLFKDDIYITTDEAREILINKNELSDNERCYQYILGEVSINAVKFDPNITTTEKWGAIEDGYAIIQNNAFERICKSGGYSKKTFLSWADKQGFLKTQSGNLTKNKKFDGSTKRCVWLKLNDDEQLVDSDGFMEIGEQETLPFE